MYIIFEKNTIIFVFSHKIKQKIELKIKQMKNNY